MGTVATVLPAVLKIAELQNKFLKVVYNAFKEYDINRSQLSGPSVDGLLFLHGLK